MKYDAASWHVDEDKAGEANLFAGSTHIGMFIAWAASQNLLGELHTREFPEDLKKLRSRSITPGAWFMEHCDGKFTDEDLSEQGNLFAQSYYAQNDYQSSAPASYSTDYAGTFTEVDSIYHTPDSWESFDRIAPIIDRRFNEWKKLTGKPSSLLNILVLGWLKLKN